MAEKRDKTPPEGPESKGQKLEVGADLSSEYDSCEDETDRRMRIE